MISNIKTNKLRGMICLQLQCNSCW